VHALVSLSYLKIKMRESSRSSSHGPEDLPARFVAGIGKSEFDHMRIVEISDSSVTAHGSTRPSSAGAGRRRVMLGRDEIAFLDAVRGRRGVRSGPGASWQQLSGDVTRGTGTRTYRVRRVERTSRADSFDRFIDEVGSTEDVAGRHQRP